MPIYIYIYIYNISLYHFIEIIKEVKINGSNLDKLLKTPLNQLEENCLDHALLAAVEVGNHNSVGKLILCGASNIDKALEESRKRRKYVVTATLLLVMAAMENDRILVLKLYCEVVQGLDTKIPLTKEDDLAELQHAMCNNTVKTVIPIEISRRCSASAVREELLLRTDVDKESGTVLWCGLHLTQLEISWLQKIYWVKKISLASNEFTSLPSNMDKYLKQCSKLDLQWNKICEIPHCLLILPSITEVNLSHNNIREIPDVPEWSASLSVLDLSYNCLNCLPNSACSLTLKHLNISNNQFDKVPHCVCSFVALSTLNIAHNSKIHNLPSELGRLKKLLHLNLNGLNNLIYPPKSARATTADCIRYLWSRLRSARGFFHMKLLLLGKYGMGKSTMVARLQGREVGNESTVGVNISEWKYSPTPNRKTFQFRIWDFAGQEEYYATYHCFLSKRSLYLLVWNITEGDAGVADLKPWLNNVSVRAPDSVVIVVGTFLDKVSEEVRQSGKIDDLLRKVQELTAQYRRLVVTNITVVGLQGRIENVQKLKDYIYNAASEYRIKNQYVMGAEIPFSYHVLDANLSTIHRRVKDGQHEPIMHAAEFKKMVRDLNLIDIQDNEELCTATHFLHEVGALLHYDDHKHHLNDLYFVDPRWLCNFISTVVTVKQYVRQGILQIKNTSLLFKDKHFPTKYFQQCLTLLGRFEIALPLDKDNERVLIPSMLPESRPAIVNEQLPGANNCYRRFIIFRPSVSGGQFYRHTNPPGLWSRLLSHIMNNVKEINHILSEQVPVEKDDLVNLTNVHLKCEICTLTSVSEESLDKPELVENSFHFDTVSTILNSSSNKSANSEEEVLECDKPAAT